MRGSGPGERFRRRAQANAVGRATGVPTDEVVARRQEQRREAQQLIAEARELPTDPERRRFLLMASRAGMMLAGTTTLGALVAACTPTDAPDQSDRATPDRGPDGPRIAIVGAGIAGLTADVDADMVILALPFTMLRQVDPDATDWSELKRRATTELGMGNNSELHLPFDAPCPFRRATAGTCWSNGPP